MSLFNDTSGPPAECFAVPGVSIWRLSVAQYHEMIRAGILAEDDPVELLDGCLVQKIIKNPPHCLATGLVRDALEKALPEGWHVKSQDPITLAASEPEPDVTVVRGSRRDYADRHPGPADVALVVEVADTGLQRDQVLKKALYAQAAIPVFWILNLVERRLEVYKEPSGPGEQPDYRTLRNCGPGEEAAVLLEGQEVARLPVASLLP